VVLLNAKQPAAGGNLQQSSAAANTGGLTPKAAPAGEPDEHAEERALVGDSAPADAEAHSKTGAQSGLEGLLAS
jgi:hypothetical protein